MKKFEYHYERRVPLIEGMNKLGKQGWELILKYQDKIIFMRELKEKKK